MITASKADTGTTKVQEQQEATVVPADSCSKGTTTVDATTEANTEQAGTPKAPMEVRDEQADTANTPAATSNPTEPIAPRPAFAFLGQVTLYEPI